MKLRYIFFILLFGTFYNGFSQGSFYNIDTIREIKINFPTISWDHILDSLYVKGDNDRIMATLTIDGIEYDSVGVRYKGFSSVSVDRIKNPFNIKLDYLIDNQNHFGVDKIKLSNVISDPSFIREVLTYEIARKYMPSSESNYANLYINDTLWGLYTNTEAVNKDFIRKHYHNRYNPFFKCNPENLDILPGGENSNLSNTHGIDSVNYYPHYDIESDNGWSYLYSLIDTLNNTSDSIDNVLNIDRVIWMHALNYSLINFDSYIGYGQNYYIYMDNNRLFNPILWDLNMSFASFRLTDASSLYYNGFTIAEAQSMDPLIHYNNISIAPRPLLRKVFENERYRKMYIAHIRTIIEENILNQDYYIRGQYLQSMIDQDVQNDNNKFYSYSDFTTNLNNSVSLVSGDCPGITELMDARASYLSSYPGYQGAPSINNVLDNNNQNNGLGTDISITAEITNASYAMLAYRYGTNDKFIEIEMYDDGNHNDSLLGDGIYGAILNNPSNYIEYYIYADNDSAGLFSPERAAYEYYTINNSIDPNQLVINEIMSNNTSTVVDQSNDYEDWIEIYNPTPYSVTTNGLYLSDDTANYQKWMFPNYHIPSDSYLIVWADEDQSQGRLHANFKLLNLGENLILSYNNSLVIDSITFPAINENSSYARSPNGTGPFNFMLPTFKWNNDIAGISVTDSEYKINCYPNPFNSFFSFELGSSASIMISDIFGRLILEQDMDKGLIKINTSSWPAGIYFLNVISNKLLTTNRIIKIK
jgi:spore coat protein CotH